MQKIAILYDASQAVLSTFDLDEVLNRILTIVSDYFHLQNGAILLLNPATQMLEVRASFGRDDAKLIPVALGQGLTGSAAQLKRPIYAPDVSAEPRYMAVIPSTRSELTIPLMVRDQVVGVLDCQSDQLDFFDAETIDLLTLFSTQASIALENARLYSLEQRRAAHLEAINAIARQTTAVVDLQELLQKLCRLILDHFPVDHVAVLLRDHEDDGLYLRAQDGSLTALLETGVGLPAGAGLAHRALDSGQPVLENDVSSVPGYVKGFAETRSELCVPLIFFREKLGVLALESARPAAFEQPDVQALESVADMCAGAIQNAFHFDQTRKLAYVDGLTGVFNRRFFETTITKEVERAKRYTSGMSLLMVDIDHFKRVNDEFGHLLGDEVLREVSRLFTQQLRKIDLVCRYGGEEFALLVPETTGANAVAVAEKLRRVVEEHDFPGVPRRVTISLGVADCPEHGETRDQLVAAADAALYAAKQAGRNRVVRASAAMAAGQQGR